MKFDIHSLENTGIHYIKHLYIIVFVSSLTMYLFFICSPDAPLFDLGGHTDRILAVDWSNPDFLMCGGVDNHLRIFKHTPTEAQLVAAAKPSIMPNIKSSENDINEAKNIANNANGDAVVHIPIEQKS